MTKRDIINYLNSKHIPYAIGYDVLYKDCIFIHRYCNDDAYAHNSGYTMCTCIFKEQQLIEFSRGTIGCFRDIVENSITGASNFILYNCPNNNPYKFKKLPEISSEIIDFIESSL